jgi:hypothetical protein
MCTFGLQSGLHGVPITIGNQDRNLAPDLAESRVCWPKAGDLPMGICAPDGTFGLRRYTQIRGNLDCQIRVDAGGDFIVGGLWVTLPLRLGMHLTGSHSLGQAQFRYYRNAAFTNNKH